MRDEYDFSNAVRNPYIKHEKKQVTLRLDEGVVEYFKSMAADNGMPYQVLINLYLCDCVEQGRKLDLKWGA